MNEMFLLKLGEVVLKGLNRGAFENRLKSNLARRLRPGEIRAAQEYMENLGLKGFTQERTSAKEEYTPPFDLTGVARSGES